MMALLVDTINMLLIRFSASAIRHAIGLLNVNAVCLQFPKICGAPCTEASKLISLCLFSGISPKTISRGLFTLGSVPTPLCSIALFAKKIVLNLIDLNIQLQKYSHDIFISSGGEGLLPNICHHVPPLRLQCQVTIFTQPIATN